ncbi:MAG TPA: hypothetical protein VIZ18_01635 [Ktedonobacteraceae bacterium]
MGKVIVFTNLTLDGVMQAPARPVKSSPLLSECITNAKGPRW